MSSVAKLQAAARHMIKPHVPSVSLRKRRYTTTDIISLVQEVLETDHDDTDQFSRLFPATRNGLEMLFNFVDATFRYVEDPGWNQWVQTPSFLAYTRRGDCKSFTVFISSVLRNMGIRHVIRYVSYGGPKYTHVYPVALIDSQEVALDVVWKKQEGGQFGAEKPYTKKKDFQVEGLYKLGNTRFSADEYISQVISTVETLKSALAGIPDSIIQAGPGDVTMMSMGAVERYIWQDRFNIWAKTEPDPGKAAQYRAAASAMAAGGVAGISGIGSELSQQVSQLLAETAKKQNKIFGAINLKIPVPAQVGGFWEDVWESAKDFLENVTEAFKQLFKKFVNWIYKDAGKKTGPYYLYHYLPRNKPILTPELKRRMLAQDESFKELANVSRIPAAHLEALNINGIKENSGRTPAELFWLAGAGHLSGVSGPRVGLTVPTLSPDDGGVPIDQWEPELQEQQSGAGKALKWIAEIFQVLFELFKNNKKAKKEDVSDIGLLIREGKEWAEYIQNQAGGGQQSGGGSGPGGGSGQQSAGGSGGLIVGLLVAMGIIMWK